MKTLVCLVEERSAKAMLERILPNCQSFCRKGLLSRCCHLRARRIWKIN